MVAILIVLSVLVLWLGSALLALYVITASDEWHGSASPSDIACAALFGPVTFMLIAWFFAVEYVAPIYRRAKRWAWRRVR